MDIKIITCHKVYNYGASLQEFALLRYLEGLNHSVQIIQYRPKYLSGHFDLKKVSNPKYDKHFIRLIYLLIKLPGRLINLRRKKVFDTFNKQYLKVSDYEYHSNNELKNNIPKSDAYIAGSDQIWNSLFENGRDPAFYLDFVPDKGLKISYAASFAISELKNEFKEFVREKVKRINFISVREITGVKILNDLGIDGVHLVLDPVFLLSRKFWVEKFVTKVKGNYIFVYDFDSNKELEKLAKKMAFQNGLRIYTVNQNIKYADKNFYLKDPKYFLSLIYNAEFVLTNSFHSTAFSIIFEKQFLVFNREEEINSRMKDLLELFELSNLSVYNCESSTIEKIDYLNVNKIMNTYITKSKLFLEESLRR